MRRSFVQGCGGRCAYWLAAWAAGILTAFSAAGEVVEMELVLAVDGSYSVDDEEFTLQMNGLATAFRNPAVVGAIESAAPDGIAVTVMQWSGGQNQVTAVPWTRVWDGASSLAFADAVGAAGRVVPLGSTAIGNALNRASGLLETNGFEGRRRVIDLSGDGTSNQGELPEHARQRIVADGVVINGLAITNEEPGLEHYYRQSVIGGFGAFVLDAKDYSDFARAMVEKLVREIMGGLVSDAAPPPGITVVSR